MDLTLITATLLLAQIRGVSKGKGNEPCGRSHTLSQPNSTPTLLIIVLENLHVVGRFYANMKHNHCLPYPSGGSLEWAPSCPRVTNHPQGTFLLQVASIKPTLKSPLIEMYAIADVMYF